MIHHNNNGQAITDFLIETFGFKSINEAKEDVIDYNKFSCVLRVHELHYIFWSEDLNYFTIGKKLERPQGQPGAGGYYKYWDYMMIPKPIRTVEEAEELTHATVNFDYLKVIVQ